MNTFTKRLFELEEIAREQNLSYLSFIEVLIRQCAYLADIEATLGDGLTTPSQEIKRYFGLE